MLRAVTKSAKEILWEYCNAVGEQGKIHGTRKNFCECKNAIAIVVCEGNFKVKS